MSSSVELVLSLGSAPLPPLPPLYLVRPSVLQTPGSAWAAAIKTSVTAGVVWPEPTREMNSVFFIFFKSGRRRARVSV